MGLAVFMALPTNFYSTRMDCADRSGCFESNHPNSHLNIELGNCEASTETTECLTPATSSADSSEALTPHSRTLQRSLPSEFQFDVPSTDPSALTFVVHVCGIFLFLFCVAAATIATAEVYCKDQAADFVRYRMTFIVLMYLVKVMLGKLVKKTLEVNSVLYQRMPRHVQEKACACLETVAWSFYFIPIVTHFVYIVFATIHDPTVHFFARYGEYCTIILFFGLVEQVYELQVRHPNACLYAHHVFGISATILLIDANPLDQKCAGALLLGIQSGFDRVTHVVFFASYFDNQRSLEQNKLQHSTDNNNICATSWRERMHCYRTLTD